jgi:hypothetical protein
VWNALSAGATTLFAAMFDEVDEGTAMFKLVPLSEQVPDYSAGSSFVALDADGCRLPSDWYLRLAGEAARALRGARVRSPELPLPDPGMR